MPTVMMEVRPIGKVPMIAAVADAAAVMKCGPGAEAAAMKDWCWMETAGAQSATMKTSAATAAVESSAAEATPTDVDCCAASAAMEAATASTSAVKAASAAMEAATASTSAVKAASATAANTSAARATMQLDRNDIRG